MLYSPHKPSAAIVCTPNHLHVPISKELLDAGVHVLCEKPISPDIATGLDLVNHAKTSSAHLIIGHHRRFNKYVTATKRLLPSLGHIIAISGLWCLCKPSSYFDSPTEWRRGPSGGPILINLIHEIDILHYLFGPIVHVFAEEAPKRRSHHAEEGAAVVLRFESGAVGTFIVCDNTPSPHNFESGTGENPIIPRTGMDFYKIFGSEGCLSVPDMRRWKYADGKEKSWSEELVEERMNVEEAKMPFALQVEHFVRVIRGEERPVCSGEDGLRALVVCEAVKKAMQAGGTKIDCGPRL
jgi:predicted dehydrogenase